MTAPFNIATRDGPCPVEGKVRACFLTIGGTRRKFAIIGENNLSDWASGYETGARLAPRMTNAALRGVKMPFRVAAQQWLDELVAKMGSTAILAVFDDKPVINP